MHFTIEHDRFATEADAHAAFATAGLHVMAVDFAAQVSGDHWHDFASRLCIVAGRLRLTVSDTGEVCDLGPGTVVVAPAGVLHREETDGYRAVIGLEADPATLSQPILKPPSAPAPR